MLIDKIDYSLYVITDRKLAGKHSVLNIVKSAVAGGATMIQYREKDIDETRINRDGKILRSFTKEAGIPFIVNDHIKIALALIADGVHVGQDDTPAFMARKMLGKDKILGVSVKTVAQAQKAVHDGADYLGVGDLFGTSTKHDAGEPIGLEELKKISRSVNIPLVGIGGITNANAASVITAGASGIAVVSAIFGKPDPEKEARELIQLIKSAKGKGDHAHGI